MITNYWSPTRFTLFQERISSLLDKLQTHPQCHEVDFTYRNGQIVRMKVAFNWWVKTYFFLFIKTASKCTN